MILFLFQSKFEVYVFYFIVRLFLLLIPFSFISAIDDRYYVQLKTEIEEQFRRTDFPSSAFPVSLEGIDKLNVSASAQFTEESFQEMLKNISKKEVTVIDLRRECHGFVNGYPVAWKLKIPVNHQEYEYNQELSADEIEEKESQFLNDLSSNKEFIGTVNSEPNVKVIAESVLNERQIVEKAGANYLRLPVSDHTWPSDEQVDQFINLVKNLPEGSWLHMHCAGGKGRTTTFLCMLDMIHNSRILGPFEIIKRQESLGGSNLWDSEKVYKDQPAIVIQRGIDRCQFLIRFHQYCLENPEFTTSWSEWVKDKR